MTSFLIVDAQSVKNTDIADTKGYDAGKKVSGIKRHIAVVVATAEVADRKAALKRQINVPPIWGKSKACWPMVATPERHLPRPSRKT